MRVLRDERGEEALEHRAVPLAQLGGDDAARAVVALERAARAQVDHARIALADAEEPRRLGRRPAERVAQQQHGALARPERLERHQEREARALEQAVAELGVRLGARERIEPVLVAPLRRRGKPRAGVRAPAPPPQRVERQVQRDPQQPRPHRLARGRRALEQSRERLLHHVVGVRRVPGQAIGEAPHPPPLAAEELLGRTRRDLCVHGPRAENALRLRNVTVPPLGRACPRRC